MVLNIVTLIEWLKYRLALKRCKRFQNLSRGLRTVLQLLFLKNYSLVV